MKSWFGWLHCGPLKTDSSSQPLIQIAGDGSEPVRMELAMQGGGEKKLFFTVQSGEGEDGVQEVSTN